MSIEQGIESGIEQDARVGVREQWEDKLPLSEIFGPTWQGEGPHTGRVCTFVRLGHCNLSCEWCDTPYTWDGERYDLERAITDTHWRTIVDEVDRRSTFLTVISGGEPLIWQQTPAWRKLIAHLTTMSPDSEVHVETNGTIAPLRHQMIKHYTVSPKLTTGDPVKKRIKPRAIEAFNELAQVEGRACFKFVCRTSDDVLDVQMFVAEHDLCPTDVWIMPETGPMDTTDDIIRRHRSLARRTLDLGFNTTTRLHTLLFGTERGH